MSFFWEDSSGTINILIKVKPNAKKQSVNGLCDVLVHYPVKKALQLSISSPPVGGKANQELVSFVSELLNIKSANISIESGNKGRIKLLQIHEKIQKSRLTNLINIP